MILVVENEPLVRLGIKTMLDDLDLDCVLAESAARAIALVENGLVPDLLITDYHLSGSTGVDLASELEARFPHIRVLIVTGDVAVSCKQHGHRGVLPKPFTGNELGSALAKLPKQH